MHLDAPTTAEAEKARAEAEPMEDREAIPSIEIMARRLKTDKGVIRFALEEN